MAFCIYKIIGDNSLFMFVKVAQVLLLWTFPEPEPHPKTVAMFHAFAHNNCTDESFKTSPSQSCFVVGGFIIREGSLKK